MPYFLVNNSIVNLVFVVSYVPCLLYLSTYYCRFFRIDFQDMVFHLLAHIKNRARESINRATYLTLSSALRPTILFYECYESITLLLHNCLSYVIWVPPNRIKRLLSVAWLSLHVGGLNPSSISMVPLFQIGINCNMSVFIHAWWGQMATNEYNTQAPCPIHEMQQGELSIEEKRN